MLSSANFVQNGSREAGFEAVELPSSPPRMRNGWPSTTSWIAVPWRRRCGIEGSAPAAGAGAAARTPITIERSISSSGSHYGPRVEGIRLGC